MAAESLLTAAYRLNRFFRIDAERGGMTTVETLQAHETLARKIEHTERGAPHDPGVLRAARDAARLFHLDATRHGGLISIKTEIAFDQLGKAIRTAGGRPPVEEATA